MIRYLRFSSFLLLTCCASKTQPVTQAGQSDCLTAAAPAFKSELYNASIDVYENHFSGLMFFKTMPDSSRNVVFTTETGLTFFNFSWDKTGKFNVQHVIKKLDRNVIITLLRKDLELILVPQWYSANAVLSEGMHAVKLKKETAFFTVSQDCKSLERVEVKHRKKSKTRVLFFPHDKNIPDSVNIEHLNFNMQLALSRIDRSYAPE